MDIAADRSSSEKSVDKRPAGILPDRARPHSIQVERAVLAAMLREPDSCINLVIEKFRSEEVFYVTAHREIFKCIIELHNKDNSATDMISVAQRLREKNKLEAVGGEVYLADIFESIATTVNLESWCQILSKYATLRKMIDVCSGSLSKCYDSDADAIKLVEEIETDIYNVRGGEQSQSILNIAELVKDEFKVLCEISQGKHEVGIPTGFAPIDECTGGLKPGEMFVLAARPSIGKTSLALNVLRNVAFNAERPRPVAFFSLEMTGPQIARRLLCTESQNPESVFWNHSFQDSDLVRLTSAVTRFKNAKIFIDPTGGITIAEMRAKARRLKMQHNIELIVIDYLQLMHADGRIESRQQEVAEISGGIKKLAKDLEIPVLVLAQLNREVDKATGAGSRPKLAHLRESGTIEQDADIVSFLHRDREESKSATIGSSVEAEWIIEKNRNGRTGNFKLLFYPSRMEFLPASPCSEEFAPGQKSG
ncbi:MAG: replicative DNA helicase [Lentisphaeria bacterium]|nr:replicative DNA helicase [Lentisphaeria bacterium]